jgi:hypothetical protein
MENGFARFTVFLIKIEPTSNRTGKLLTSISIIDPTSIVLVRVFLFPSIQPASAAALLRLSVPDP